MGKTHEAELQKCCVFTGGDEVGQNITQAKERDSLLTSVWNERRD